MEQIGIAPVTSATTVTEYNPEKDIGFYTVKGKYYTSNPNIFFILFPGEAHKPGIKADGSDTEKKIVIKIKAVD